MLQHSEDRSKNRLLTPSEHARCMTMPAELVADLCRTTAHEILGQSVIWQAFRALGQRIAQSFQASAKDSRPAPAAMPRQLDLLAA